MAVETLWEISRVGARCATGKTKCKALRGLMKSGIRGCPASPGSLLTFGYICRSKNDEADSDSHRQIRGEV